MIRRIIIGCAIASGIFFLSLIATAVLHGVGIEPANPLPLYAGIGFGLTLTGVLTLSGGHYL